MACPPEQFTAIVRNDMVMWKCTVEALGITLQSLRTQAGGRAAMHIVIPDDHQQCVRHLACCAKLAGHVDLQACPARGVLVAEGSGTGSATAELAWALVLASRRHLVDEANRLRSG